MKRIITFLIFVSLLSPCRAQSEWDKMWEEIKNQIADGKFDDSGFNLGGFDVKGWLDDFLGGIMGGSKEFGDGGVFGSGGIFDITNGGFLQNLFGNVFGFDEIHNDASLNNNVTWGILHSKYQIHPKITDRQKKIMAIQDTINLSVKRLWELEKLTQDYLNTKQSDAVDIEIYQDLVNTLEDVGTLYRVNNQLADKSSNLQYVKDRQNIIVVRRTLELIYKFPRFARTDGNNNLLNNDDRNEIVTYLIKDFRELRSILASTYKVLYVAANEQEFQNIIRAEK